MDCSQAQQLLKTALANPEAEFRNGQWEAIDALVNQSQKLLVVQRTGWGKSSVYFISTKIFRDRGMGPTIIVSPLLALMRNQIESARNLDVVAETMNSTNHDDWQAVTQRILNNQVEEQIEDLFSSPTQSELFAEPEPKLTLGSTPGKDSRQEINEPAVSADAIDFYQLFVSELQHLAKKPVTVDELIEKTDLHKTQINTWLKRAVDEALVQKLHRPVRYQVVD